MSFNRTLYDLEKRVWDREAIQGEGNYRLYKGSSIHRNIRYANFGLVGSKSDVSRTSPDDEFSVTAENKLNRQLNNSDFVKVKTFNRKNLNVVLNEDTRFTHPLEEYRGLQTFSYNLTPYLYVDPQRNILHHHDSFGINTKLFTKDNFVPQYPTCLDKGEALPNCKLKRKK